MAIIAVKNNGLIYDYLSNKLKNDSDIKEASYNSENNKRQSQTIIQNIGNHSMSILYNIIFYFAKNK
jgi:hypothetical protein